MVNEEQLMLNSKQRKEALERKKVLIQLSKDVGFESRMFPLEFKHNTKESLRYFLWQCELQKWLVENRLDELEPIMKNFMYIIEIDRLEHKLTEILKILLPDDTCKK